MVWAKIKVLIEILRNTVKIGAYFFSPRQRERKLADEILKLENKYANALHKGDSSSASAYRAQLKQLRSKKRISS